MTNAMKASIKFRDDQKPLLRAKVPISILGLPFLSGVSAGESKELRLDLGTAFESGPSFRVSYRPNDPSTPFSLVVKTGVGSFGSPIQAPFAMSAEFNLIGPGAIGSGPRFSILIKPRFGDFVLKKSVQSNSVESVVKKIVIDNEKSSHDAAAAAAAAGAGRTAIGFYPFESGFTTDVAKSTNGLLSGMELNARSVLPFFNRANVNFRWGLRVPPELSQVNSSISVSKMPLLVMNKLSIEHMARNSKEPEKRPVADVADAVPGAKLEFDAVKAESGLLRRAVEDLRAEIVGWRAHGIGSTLDDVSRNGPQPAVAGKRDRRNNGKVSEGSWPSGLEEVKSHGAKLLEKK